MSPEIQRCLEDRHDLLAKGYWVRTEMNEFRIANFHGQYNSDGLMERQLAQWNYVVFDNQAVVIIYPTP